MCALGRWMGKEMTPLASLRWIVRGLCKWVGEIYKAIHTATFLDALIPNLKNHAGPFLKRHLGFFSHVNASTDFTQKSNFIMHLLASHSPWVISIIQRGTSKIQKPELLLY